MQNFLVLVFLMVLNKFHERFCGICEKLVLCIPDLRKENGLCVIKRFILSVEEELKSKGEHLEILSEEEFELVQKFRKCENVSE